MGIEAVGCGGIDVVGEVAPGTVPGPMGFVGSMVGMVVGEFGMGVCRRGGDGGGVNGSGVCRIGEK